MGDVQMFTIPDEVCEKAGLTAKWIPGDQLVVHAYQHVTTRSEDRPTSFAGREAKVHSIRLHVMLFDHNIRKLINESNGTFLTEQKLVTKLNKTELRHELIKLSRQYRSIIRACLESLQETAKANNSKPETLELISVFYNVEFLWHLCEILYVDVIPGDLVLPQLLEWVRFHFFHCERQAKAILKEHSRESFMEPGAESHPEFWKTLTNLVLQGRVEMAKVLLQQHSHAHMELFKSVDAALRNMPVYTVFGGISLAEFNMRWKNWQLTCQTKVQSGVFSSIKELELIMKILAGDEDAFRQVKDQCESWYCYMAAWLLYKEPTVKSFDLSHHANHCIAQFGGLSRMTTSDIILLSLMESDLHNVIKLIQESSENGWFAAHLTNLLYHCDCLSFLDTQHSNMASRLHQHLLTDYGRLLMSHRSLWQVGVSYLDHCGTEGRTQLELLLPRLALTTESRALKIIQVARERDMHDIVKSICKVLGMRSYHRHQLGNALMWALRSQDAGFATFLADKYLEVYSREGQFHSTDLLYNLGSCMLVSDRLTFLGKYCEFHQLYHAGEFREAATLLVSLLVSRLAPKYFWITLFTDALPLLECNNIVLTSEETYELLNSLEELVGDEDVDPKKLEVPDLDNKDGQGDSDSIFEEKCSLIRLALSRNLSRALIHEGCLVE